MMNSVLLLVSALAILAPNDGAVVPTQRDGQKAYLSSPRAARFVRMDNAADRAKLLACGSRQLPLKLEWSGETNAVFSLSVAAEGEADETFVLTNRTTAYLTNLEVDRAYRWTVRRLDSEDCASASFRTEPDAPRFLRADGVGNFRDLGGWRTSDGRMVRQNRIFRSAGLRASSKIEGGFFRKKVRLGDRRVTEAGLATLRDEFRIRTDLELRTPQETAGMDGTLLGDNVQWSCISFAAYDFVDNQVRGREPFARLFRLFTKEENYPVLMHCSGGRDRTGTLAFLLNGLLGVSEEDLCRDWESSVFSDAGMKFSSDRIQRLIDYLGSLPGDTLRDRVESYAKSCGITADEIAEFRSLMLK